MTASVYNNYQFAGSSPSNDASIVSTTPFGGGVSIAPTPQNERILKSEQSYTPMFFDFPPELQSSLSDLSSASTLTTNSKAIVPYYYREPEPTANNRHFSSNGHMQRIAPSTLVISPRSTSDTDTIQKIRVPRSPNPSGSDSVHPKKNKMKKQRKLKTAGGTVGGAVFGGLVLGPLGLVMGGAAGGVAANKICKARERRAQRTYEQHNFQRAATQSVIHTGAFC
jgi:hypothetical protein